MAIHGITDDAYLQLEDLEREDKARLLQVLLHAATLVEDAKSEFVAEFLYARQ